MMQGGLVLGRGGLVVLLALASGCAPVVPAAPVAEGPGLPDWVLVVPPPGPDRAFYVGGCSAAPDTAGGVAVAVADARAQAERAVRGRFAPLVDRSFREAGVETTAIERSQFRALVIEPVVERLVGALRRERAFHRRCGGPPGTAGAPSGVCDVFVLMTEDLTAWERVPVEIMADLRKTRQSVAGDSTSVRLLDWLLREYGRSDIGSGAGGRDDGQP